MKKDINSPSYSSKYAKKRELRKKKREYKRQAKQKAIITEYDNILREIKQLENYFTTTPYSNNDVDIIETYKDLLSKKYDIEQNGDLPSNIFNKRNNALKFTQYIDTTVCLEWRDIVFGDGKITFQYDNKFYNIDVYNAREAFNQLIPTFAKRLSAIKIEIKHSIAHIGNPIDFNNVIELLQWCHTVFHIEDCKKENYKILTLNKIPTSLIRQVFSYNKTIYLNYLQNNQDDNIPIIPVFESHSPNPDGFLFTLKRNKEYLIVWESNQETANKATYIFQSPTSQLHNLQQLIFDYIYSDIPNKRHHLRRNKVREFLGFNYQYADHDNFSSWTNILENCFNENIGIKMKNENRVSYLINQERTYTPTHNIIQNKLKTYLENLGTYTEVLLESDNVDIKAITLDREWHYFELKTSTPRQCIREALGQILEYAHYPFDNRAKKLYIIGCYALQENEIKYMNLLRTIYNLPIWYKWFDENTNCLSDDF